MLRVRRLIIALAVLGPLLTYTQVAADWPTYHGNNTRQGDDTTDQAVSGTVGWTSAALDGQLYGQPVINGNQLIVATENDTVYSLNATTGAVVWTKHVPTPTAVPRTDNFPCGDITPLGITGTPVIDAGNVYVLAEVETTPTTFQFDLVTLDAVDGSDHARREHESRQPRWHQLRRQLPAAARRAHGRRWRGVRDPWRPRR